MLKKRRIVVAAFLVVAILALGIGYAAVSTTLDFMGTASVSTAATENVLNADVVFTAAEAVASNGGTTSTAVLAMNDKRISFEAKDFAAIGDKVTIVGTIKNKGDADYNVSITPRLVAPATTNDYFDIAYAFVDDDTDTTNIIEKESTRDYELVITLKKMPTDTTITLTVTLELTATAING